MNRDYYIKNKVYNSTINDALWDKLSRKEELAQEERDYVSYCYHVEEYRAGLL